VDGNSFTLGEFEFLRNEFVHEGRTIVRISTEWFGRGYWDCEPGQELTTAVGILRQAQSQHQYKINHLLQTAAALTANRLHIDKAIDDATGRQLRLV
jgi:hypothetical protein